MNRLDTLVRTRVRALALSDAQLARIEHELRQISGWLGQPGTTLGDASPSLYTQGSVTLRTSIAPKRRGGFDADLVCELGDAAEWVERPRSAFEAVGQRLRAMPGFGGEVRQKKRCWAVIYDSAFHVDVTPAVRAVRETDSDILVFDGELGTWKASDPLGFSSWFCDRASLIGTRAGRVEPLIDRNWRESYSRATPLAAAVQLLKRRRDLTFGSAEPELSSIVLTTLAGRHYRGEPTTAAALSHILRAVATEAESVRSVRNPVLPAEILTDNWTRSPDAFDAFRHFVDDLVRGFGSAERAQDDEKMTQALDDLFGVIPSTSREMES